MGSSGIPGPTFPQLFPSLLGRRVSLIPQRGRAGAGSLVPPSHMCCRIHAAGLSPPPVQSPGAQPVPWHQPQHLLQSPTPPFPHKLLSLPSGPSFQLVIGLRGQNCEMCLNHRSLPPTDAHLYAVLSPLPAPLHAGSLLKAQRQTLPLHTPSPELPLLHSFFLPPSQPSS